MDTAVRGGGGSGGEEDSGSIFDEIAVVAGA